MVLSFPYSDVVQLEMHVLQTLAASHHLHKDELEVTRIQHSETLQSAPQVTYVIEAFGAYVQVD